METIIRDLKSAKRVVVKVGTSSITHPDGKINFSGMEKLVVVLSDLQKAGKEVVLVSSGAIGVGVGRLGLSERPKTVQGKQAAAAVGQSELMTIYSEFFHSYGFNVAQLLLTNDILDNKEATKNVTNTFEELLRLNVIPIVNENDTVSIQEINAGKKNLFNENDTLAALVAKLIKADLLIIFSDIDGLYDKDPKTNADSKIISIIKEVTPEIIASAGGAGTTRGTGGMLTKINAAKMAIDAGIYVVLANGADPNVIHEIFRGNACGSIFVAKDCKKD